VNPHFQFVLDGSALPIPLAVSEIIAESALAGWQWSSRLAMSVWAGRWQ